MHFSFDDFTGLKTRSAVACGVARHRGHRLEGQLALLLRHDRPDRTSDTVYIDSIVFLKTTP